MEVGNYQTLQNVSQITGQRVSKKMRSERGCSISALGPQLPGMSVCSLGYSEAGGFKGEHQPEGRIWDRISRRQVWLLQGPKQGPRNPLLKLWEWRNSGKFCQVAETISFFFLKFISNCSIIAVQCCVGFYHTTMWVSHKYTYIPSLLSLLPTETISYSLKFMVPGPVSCI